MSSAPERFKSTKLISHINKLDEATSAAGAKLKSSFRALARCAETFPPIKSALDDMSELVKVLENIGEDKLDIKDVFADLQASADALEPYITRLDSGESSGSIALIIKSIHEHIQYVKCRREQGLLRGSDAIEQARKVEKLLKRLHDDVALRTWDNTARQLDRGACTLGTRQELLETLQNWAGPGESQLEGTQPKDLQDIDCGNAKAFWINGMAGTGKTTVAYSLCKWLETNTQLGASFFCSRTSTPCQKTNNIVPTIAYQLGRFSPAFRSAVCKVLRNDPDAATYEVRVQLDMLILRPMLMIKDAMPSGVVVVIDALDECADSYGAGTVVEFLLDYAKKIPVKFFISSRPEPVIREKMLSCIGSSSSMIHLHDVDASIVQADIQKYLTAELKYISPRPTEAQILQLTQQAGRLFIYAATLVRYINPRGARVPSKTRLETILAINTPKSQARDREPANLYRELDQLYNSVLEMGFSELLEEHEAAMMRDILGTVVCAKEPVTIDTLAGLLGSTTEDISYMIGSLHSVLHVPDRGGLISTLHASFHDFLLNRSRAREAYYSDEARRNEIIAQSCFRVMKKQLRFNICHLQSSFVADSDVLDLDEQIKQSVSSELVYACRYWSEHLQSSNASISEDSSCVLAAMLDDFLSTRLLFWLEVMNLAKCKWTASLALRHTRAWLQANNLMPEYWRGLLDAYNFCAQFEGGGCSQSTPHIYISALPQCKTSNLVYRNYRKLLKDLLEAGGPALSWRGDSQLKSFHMQSLASGLAFSHDSTRIFCGTSREVRIQSLDDAAIPSSFSSSHGLRAIISLASSLDGSILVVLIEGHVEVYNIQGGYQIYDLAIPSTSSSVGVSHTKPTSIATGHNDGTIWLHALHSERPDGLLLKGHKYSVNSVTFSPTCMRLASGSNDKHVRIWSLHSGAWDSQVLTGHSDWVNSVTFSSDGALIASGSVDSTVRLWDAYSGAPLRIFSGHTNSVRSVAISPNCTQIASGSRDKTVRLWDLRTGKEFGEPRKHIDWVESVAFSPNGSYIASCSGHKIVLWDASSDTLDRPPYDNHAVSTSLFASANDSRAWSDAWDVWTNPDILWSQRSQLLLVGFSSLCIRIFLALDEQGGTAEIWDIRLLGAELKAIDASSNINQPQVESKMRAEVSGPLTLTQQDGWLRDANERLLYWFPPEAHQELMLLRPHALLAISDAAFGYEFWSSKLAIGDQWVRCYSE
ncbi:Vegetative incompatibility protein HET-E-1 [Rhizoctonia solani]|uniref:Vegetative incompatibility protein HET-E-1 n=1 Tax=Rhizoctonia solani TaxID=456999 RepID=A0A8H8SZ35_9AGAM|nr:Vegetative incompatibility protein HET-E-1 [Rhizoctonia solani]QRW21988.1 Vegetative incompatibility protein HET-E-1 [Rhizoctonia solani]